LKEVEIGTAAPVVRYTRLMQLGTRLMQLGTFFQGRVAVLSFVLIAGCGPSIRVGEPNEPVVVQALEAVDRFHTGVKQRRYQDICQAAESDAFLAATSLSCPEFLLYFHQKLGDPVSARRTQLPSIGDRRSDGTVTVELGYRTEYEHGTAQERFDWRVKGTAVILMHYDAEADALSR
jgi:hypothetical protein